MGRPIRVHSSWNSFEAHIVKTALEQAGISVTLKNELLAPLAGALPMGDVMAEVWIDEADEELAAQILKKTQGELSLTNPQAPGGELSEAEDRMCKSCGETSPAHFTECWSCQSAL